MYLVEENLWPNIKAWSDLRLKPAGEQTEAFLVGLAQGSSVLYGCQRLYLWSGRLVDCGLQTRYSVLQLLGYHTNSPGKFIPRSCDQLLNLRLKRSNVDSVLAVEQWTNS